MGRYKLSYISLSASKDSSSNPNGIIKEDITLVSVDESIPSMLAGSVGFFGSVDDFSATISPRVVEIESPINIDAPNSSNANDAYTAPSVISSVPVSINTSSPFTSTSRARDGDNNNGKSAALSSSLFVSERPQVGEKVAVGVGVQAVLHDAERREVHLLYISKSTLGWVKFKRSRWPYKTLTIVPGGGEVLIKDIVAIETGVRTASFVGNPDDGDCFSVLTERGTLDVEANKGKRDGVVEGIRTGIEGGLRIV